MQGLTHFPQTVKGRCEERSGFSLSCSLLEQLLPAHMTRHAIVPSTTATTFKWASYYLNQTVTIHFRAQTWPNPALMSMCSYHNFMIHMGIFNVRRAVQIYAFYLVNFIVVAQMTQLCVLTYRGEERKSRIVASLSPVQRGSLNQADWHFLSFSSYTDLFLSFYSACSNSCTAGLEACVQILLMHFEALSV